MRNIVIFGTGSTADHVMKILKKDIVQVIAFLDNKISYEFFYGIKVLEPCKIQELDYDYILIASVYGNEIEDQLCKYGVSSKKILKMVMDKKGGETALTEYHYLINNPFKKKLKDFLLQEKEIKVLITGISYHNDGIDAMLLSRPTYNFAIRGQDIYYDYAVVKHLFERYNEKVKKVKNVIIGLSYYSFDYDFSKSSSAIEALRYYPEIKEAHNFIDNRVIESVLNNISLNLEKYKEAYNLFSFGDHYELSYEAGKISATKDCEKNFPYTVIENSYILKEYLMFLLERNIKPTILIMPVTKYYAKYYNHENIRKFYTILDSVVQSCNTNIQILDYFNKVDIQDEYWYHINHLNYKGAQLFTMRLDREIEW